MNELISKQAAIEAINVWLYCDKDERMPADVIKALPTVQPDVPDMNDGNMEPMDVSKTEQADGWMERNKDRILQAGLEGREVEFRIGGRLFAIKEKAQ